MYQQYSLFSIRYSVNRILFETCTQEQYRFYLPHYNAFESLVVYQQRFFLYWVRSFVLSLLFPPGISDELILSLSQEVRSVQLALTGYNRAKIILKTFFFFIMVYSKRVVRLVSGAKLTQSGNYFMKIGNIESIA